jgi:hypothetical protein
MECYLPLECREMEIDGKRWGARTRRGASCIAHSLANGRCSATAGGRTPQSQADRARDHVGGLRQLGHDLPKRSRGARKSVQKQHGGPGRLTCRDEGQLRAAGQTKSLPGRRAHFRATLFDRLTSRNIYAEAILPTGCATSQVGTQPRRRLSMTATERRLMALRRPRQVGEGPPSCSNRTSAIVYTMQATRWRNLRLRGEFNLYSTACMRVSHSHGTSPLSQ